MREIRPYGSEGGVPRKRGIPTPINSRKLWIVLECGRVGRHPDLLVAGVLQKARIILFSF